MRRAKALVVMPTYNEVENIAPMLLRITAEVPDVDVLVVDDSSPDGTGQAVARLARQDSRIHLLTRPKKEGLAAAYVAGFRWAIEHDYDRIVEMDADFSHDPAYLPELLAGLDTHDVVAGTRYVPGGGTSGWGVLRKCISRGGNLYAKFVLGVPYEDLTGGFTAWTRRALERIDYRSVRSRGYAFQVELKYRAHCQGLRIREIPIRFENRRHGSSKMSGRIVWEAAYLVWHMKRTTDRAPLEALRLAEKEA